MGGCETESTSGLYRGGRRADPARSLRVGTAALRQPQFYTTLSLHTCPTGCGGGGCWDARFRRAARRARGQAGACVCRGVTRVLGGCGRRGVSWCAAREAGPDTIRGSSGVVGARRRCRPVASVSDASSQRCRRIGAHDEWMASRAVEESRSSESGPAEPAYIFSASSGRRLVSQDGDLRGGCAPVRGFGRDSRCRPRLGG